MPIANQRNHFNRCILQPFRRSSFGLDVGEHDGQRMQAIRGRPFFVPLTIASAAPRHTTVELFNGFYWKVRLEYSTHTQINKQA